MITADEARALTDRAAACTGDAASLVVECYQREAWRALEYPSWAVYCTAEITSDLRLHLPQDHRRDLVRALGDADLSIKAITEVTGVARNTVRGDLVSEHVHPARVRLEDGTEGRRYRDTGTRARYPDDVGYTTTVDATIIGESGASTIGEEPETRTVATGNLDFLSSLHRMLDGAANASTRFRQAEWTAECNAILDAVEGHIADLRANRDL